jgi:hypothetical protein
MSFSPHEFERSQQPLPESLQWLDETYNFHDNRFVVALQGIGGVTARNHERRSSRIAYYESFHALTEQMDRLGMTPDNEVCHRMDLNGLETWIVAVGRTVCKGLGNDEVRIVVDRNATDPANPERPLKWLQDCIIDCKKVRLDMKMAAIPREDGRHDFRYDSKTPPRFDHRKFHMGNGVGLQISAGYVPPVPSSPKYQKLSQLRKLNLRINDLANLLGLLDELTEQATPEWNNGQETA